MMWRKSDWKKRHFLGGIIWNGRRVLSHSKYGLLGLAAPKAIGGYSVMAKYRNRHGRLKAACVDKKSDTLHTLCSIYSTLDLAMLAEGVQCVTLRVGR